MRTAILLLVLQPTDMPQDHILYDSFTQNSETDKANPRARDQISKLPY